MRWIAVTVLLMIVGCSALNPAPKRSVIRTLKDANRLIANGHEITDEETIDGLCNIYRTAKWRPFFDTEPVDQISIKVFHGDEQILEFTYGAGWLMDDSRKGVLSEKQEQWFLENIRSGIPAEILPDRNIL